MTLAVTVAPVLRQIVVTVASTGLPGVGVPKGGAAGQVPVKVSGADYDLAWTDVGTQVELDAAVASLTAALAPKAAPNLTGVVTVTPGADAGVGLVVKGRAAQTGDLAQWQSSAGAVLGGISAGGGLFLNASGNANGRWTVGVATATAGQLDVSSTLASRVAAVVKGAAAQTADLQQWQDSAGAVLAKVDSTGSVTAKYATLSGRLFVAPDAPATVPMIVRGVGSQTADLTQWQDSGGGIGASIERGGALNVTPTLAANGYAAFLRAPAAGVVPIMARGAASQTSDLQQWQNSTGTIGALVDRNGRIASAPFNGLTGNAQLPASGYFETAGTGSVGVIVKGIVGQTANLSEWRDSANGAVATLASTGTFTTSGRFAAGNGTATGAMIEAKSGAPGQVTSAFQGAAGQTADLAQWQSSGGSPLARVTSAGVLLATALWATTESQLSIGGFTDPATGFGAALKLSSNGTYGIAALATAVATVPLMVKGAAGQTGNLAEWQTNAGAVVASISPSGTVNTAGRFAAGALPTGSAQLDVSLSGNPTRVGAIIKAAVSQTGDMQQWQDSAGGLLARLDSNGAYAGTRIAAGTSNVQNAARLFTVAGGPTEIALVVRGAASQTADLAQWQDNTGTVGAKVLPSGDVVVQRMAQTAQNVTLSAGGAGGQSLAASSAPANPKTFTISNLQTVGDTASVQNRIDMIIGVAGSGVATLALTQAGTVIQPFGASVPGAIVRGIVGQTASLQEWQGSDGVGKTYVGADGSVTINNPNGAITALTVKSTSVFDTGSATAVGVVVKGRSGQSFDMQQWQDNTAAILASVDSAGRLKWSAGNRQTTVGAAGGASALPATPTRYLRVVDSDGTVLVVPAYAAA